MKKLLLLIPILIAAYAIYYFYNHKEAKVIEQVAPVSEYVEEEIINYEVRSEIFKAKNYLAIMYDSLNMNDISGDFFAKNYTEIGNQIANFGNGLPTVLYFVWDTQHNIAKMAVAIPVDEIPAKIEKGFQLITIPENESYFVNYYGPYNRIEGAHESINEFIFSNRLKTDYVAIEEYITDPATEPDTSKWLTKVSYVKL